jgi:aryl-alcohol dehydrogenase-like predicted oxidoreductase
MSRLALGTVQFGLGYGIANTVGQVGRAEARTMLETAVRHGVDMLDTAISYGESEACLGELDVRRFSVVTKIPPLPADCQNVKEWVSEQVSASLRRLDLDSVYAILLHKSSDLLSSRGPALYDAMQSFKETGQANKIGVSIYSPSELDALVPKFRPELVQAPLNLLDRRLTKTRWLMRLKELGVEVHTRSCFLQGLLLMPPGMLPSQFSDWGHLWSTWHAWLSDRKTTALEACLAFPLSQQLVDRVVIGADSVSQLEQIFRAERSAYPVWNEFPDIESDSPKLIDPSLWQV